MTEQLHEELGHAGLTFAPETPVWPSLPGSPRYGDDPWDLTDVITRTSMAERRMSFATLSDQHVTTVKNVLMVLAAPDRRESVEAGIVRRGGGTTPNGLYGSYSRLLTISGWSTSAGPGPFADWTQGTADRFLDDLKTGAHRPGGYGVGSGAIRSYVETLRTLRAFREVLPDPLPFRPWQARSANTIAGEQDRTENSTPPLTWQTWAPLVAAAWVVVDQYSDDIIAAVAAREALPREARGPSGRNAVAALHAWDEAGGVMPLHTGQGRTRGKRGAANRSLLFRQLGINDSVLKPANHQYSPEAVAMLAAAAADPARRQLGGLLTPTALVEHPDGRTTPWIAELGLGEAEYLESVLRAACYVLIASLTGMRDSELQELTRDTLTTKDGLPALRSIQFKGNDAHHGESQSWWAPKPIVRTVQVLTRLSAHETHLFAREAGKAGAYAAGRDLPRLVDFVNADPAGRVGRGEGLALAPIPLDPRQTVNATVLRRSFAVNATTHPGAELGLGLQLGHTAWRMTTGYASDGQQQAVKHIDEERRRVLHQDAATLLTGQTPVAGPAAAHITEFRAQVIADPARADRLAASVADRLHLGLTNDCMWNPATSGCGSERPQLGDHVCVGIECTNALLRAEHRPVIATAIERIDTFLNSGRGNPALVKRLRGDRTNLARVRRQLTQSEDPEETDAQP